MAAIPNSLSCKKPSSGWFTSKQEVIPAFRKPSQSYVCKSLIL
jgi:hypothetical protein